MCYQTVTFDEEAVKKCIEDISLNRIDREIYFSNIKEKKINEFADKTNESFNKMIEEICRGIDEANNIYQLRKIGVALGKLTQLSKRLYFSEVEFFDSL